MDAITRLRLLSDQMRFEPDEETPAGGARPGCFQPSGAGLAAAKAEHIHVQPAQLPGGRQIMLLKTLLSSACERDCYYCPFRAGRDFRRATFKPQEFGQVFMRLAQARAAEGVFLS
ncbi:MAG: hypothetical protein WHV44_12030, partial [Anaerolineales bacterium]